MRQSLLPPQRLVYTRWQAASPPWILASHTGKRVKNPDKPSSTPHRTNPNQTNHLLAPRHAAPSVPPLRLAVALTPSSLELAFLGLDRMGVHLLKKQHSSASATGGGSSGAPSMPPKGCMAVRVVGPGGGAEEERFVVPVGYLKHPLFVGLLKEAEEEYGFEQKGAITIPCGVDNFRRVQGIIHHQKHHSHGGGLLSGGGHHGSGHHHFHIAACFRA